MLAMADVINMPAPRLCRQALTASWLARQAPKVVAVLQPLLDRWASSVVSQAKTRVAHFPGCAVVYGLSAGCSRGLLSVCSSWPGADAEL